MVCPVPEAPYQPIGHDSHTSAVLAGERDWPTGHTSQVEPDHFSPPPHVCAITWVMDSTAIRAKNIE